MLECFELLRVGFVQNARASDSDMGYPVHSAPASVVRAAVSLCTSDKCAECLSQEHAGCCSQHHCSCSPYICQGRHIWMHIRCTEERLQALRAYSAQEDSPRKAERQSTCVTTCLNRGAVVLQPDNLANKPLLSNTDQLIHGSP